MDAVVKWTAPNDKPCFGLLKTTIATKCKCNAEVILKLATPFLEEQLAVCYIALVLNKFTQRNLRLDPELIDHDLERRISLRMT